LIGRFVFLGLVALGFTVYLTSPGSKVASADVALSCGDGAMTAGHAQATARATFAWHAPKKDARQSFLDLSLAPGFVPGWYQGHGPIAAAQTTYAVDGLPLNATFYYRVNTLFGDGWHETARGTFVSTCK
jgi:hypothetical protein